MRHRTRPVAHFFVSAECSIFSFYFNKLPGFVQICTDGFENLKMYRKIAVFGEFMVLNREKVNCLVQNITLRTYSK